MIINGEAVVLEQEMTMQQYLEQESYPKNRIAVELNGNILPKSQYETYVMQQDDKIEIVCFVGGG